jgi:hypothetical protein
MSIGIWFAYCDQEKLLPLDELARRLKLHSELTLKRDEENLLVVTVHDRLTRKNADIEIGINTSPYVRLEAAELAEEDLPVDPGVPPPDSEILQRASARYELSWELRFSDETYNILVWIAEELIQACEAIIYDASNHRFV